MHLSVFDLFSVGIGPSSSHTVGPMRAARRFAAALGKEGLLERTVRIESQLYGSLGWTGKGHGSDIAVLMGLEGEEPETIDADSAPGRMEAIKQKGELKALGFFPLAFDYKRDIVFHKKEVLPVHPNGMRFTAFDADGTELCRKDFYSVGGGFIVGGQADPDDQLFDTAHKVPYPFSTGEELLELCEQTGQSIAWITLANEAVHRPAHEVKSQLLDIWRVMNESIERGLSREGILPGGMKVKRRAPSLAASLEARARTNPSPMHNADQVNVWALAVSEENANGGRVVTAPTNGAAGIIPAVIKHLVTHYHHADEDEAIVNFLLTAAAVGMLYKINASISGAEVGCQGEVGVACSMAAAGLAEALEGTPAQVENAAEIGMEHNLGLTCDPVGGLVQVPCIERNAMGALKAINAARLALHGDGTHFVSLDKVIKTMRDTGADMETKYKETSRGGLAVNVIEC